MTTPQRIQLSRRKGWRMPANTVKVCRPTKWGNPFRAIGSDIVMSSLGRKLVVIHKESNHEAKRGACGLYEAYLNNKGQHGAIRDEGGAMLKVLAPIELRGKNLACWCKIGEPCHADILLQIANAPQPTRAGGTDV